jgi:hypothetical protein
VLDLILAFKGEQQGKCWKEMVKKKNKRKSL